MGKWNEETIAEHRGRLGPIVEECQKLSNGQLAEAYVSYRRHAAECDQKLKNAADHVRAAEMVFAERFAEDDVSSMKFDNGLLLSMKVEQGYAFDDKDAFVAWLKEKGYDHELTVPSQSLRRIVESLDAVDLAGAELPPGVRRGEPFTKFSARGLK